MSLMNETLRIVVALLVDGEYQALDNLTGGERLKAADIERAVRDFGHRLAMPPSDGLPPTFNVIQTALPGEYAVDLYLWTEDLGESDLSLELTLRERDQGLFAVQIDNIRVM